MKRSLARLESLLSPAQLRLAVQFTKFAIVGASGTAVDFGVWNFLLWMRFHLYLSKAFSFVLAVVNNFTWNSRWTFGDLERKAPARRLVQFAIVSTVGLALNLSLVYMFIEYSHLWHNWANALATILVLFWNFSANRLWTFRED